MNVNSNQKVYQVRVTDFRICKHVNNIYKQAIRCRKEFFSFLILVLSKKIILLPKQNQPVVNGENSTHVGT